MSQQNLDPGTTANFFRVQSGAAFGLNRQTLGGDITLDKKCCPVQLLDPGGADRTVSLPDLSDFSKEVEGIMFMVVNMADAAEDITLADLANSSATVATVNQDDMAFVFWDPSANEWAGKAV